MRTKPIILGEREYTLTEIPLRKARAFRENVKEHFGGLVALFENAPSTDITNMTQMASLMRVVGDTLLGSVDTLLNLLYSYSPLIAADKEYVEDNAVGSQVVDAFLVTIELSFPFFESDRAKGLIRTILQLGSKSSATSTN